MGQTAVEPERVGEVVRLRVKLPLHREWRLRWVLLGRCMEFDLVWCSARSWRRQDRPGEWQVCSLWPFIIAAQLVA